MNRVSKAACATLTVLLAVGGMTAHSEEEKTSTEVGVFGGVNSGDGQGNFGGGVSLEGKLDSRVLRTYLLEMQGGSPALRLKGAGTFFPVTLKAGALADGHGIIALTFYLDSEAQYTATKRPSAVPSTDPAAFGQAADDIRRGHSRILVSPTVAATLVGMGIFDPWNGGAVVGTIGVNTGAGAGRVWDDDGAALLLSPKFGVTGEGKVAFGGHALGARGDYTVYPGIAKQYADGRTWAVGLNYTPYLGGGTTSVTLGVSIGGEKFNAPAPNGGIDHDRAEELIKKVNLQFKF